MSHPNRQREHTRQRSYGCFFRSLAVLLVSIFACGIGTSSCIIARQRQYRHELDTVIAEIRARDEPIDAADVEALHQPRDDEIDVTEFYLRAFAALKDDALPSDEDRPFLSDFAPLAPLPGEPWEHLDDAEKFLDEHGEVLKLLHEAAQAPGTVRYRRERTPPPHLEIRAATRLLYLEAAVRMHRGDSHGALKSLLTALEVSDSLRSEPLLISHLFRTASFGLWTRELGRFLSPATAAELDLVRLQARLQDVEFAPGLTRALQADRANVYEYASTQTIGALEEEMEEWKYGVALREQSLAEHRPGDLAKLLTTHTQVVEASKHPFPKAIDEGVAARKRLTTFLDGDKQRRFPWEQHVLTDLLAPVVVEPFHRTAGGIAQQRASLVAIAIERHRLAHGGELPETLEALVPSLLDAVPQDPFDGQPLRYHQTHEGYVVYSVGEDKGDDYGLLVPPEPEAPASPATPAAPPPVSLDVGIEVRAGR